MLSRHGAGNDRKRICFVRSRSGNQPLRTRSLNLTHNVDAKNSISIGIGGSPEIDVPDGFLPNFDPLLLGTAAVSGLIYLDGRILAPPTLSRIKTLASMSEWLQEPIENNPTADGFHAEGESVSFSVNYTENPVMYFGLNYGVRL